MVAKVMPPVGPTDVFHNATLNQRATSMSSGVVNDKVMRSTRKSWQVYLYNADLGHILRRGAKHRYVEKFLQNNQKENLQTN